MGGWVHFVRSPGRLFRNKLLRSNQNLVVRDSGDDSGGHNGRPRIGHGTPGAQLRSRTKLSVLAVCRLSPPRNFYEAIHCDHLLE